MKKGFFRRFIIVRNIFFFHLLRGDPKKALDAPHKVVITENMAKKVLWEC